MTVATRAACKVGHGGSSVSTREFDLRTKVGQPPTWTIPASHIKGGTVDQLLPLPTTAVAIVKALVRLAEAAGSEFLLPSPLDTKQPLADKTLTQTFRRMERTGRIGPRPRRARSS
jgi:hypothetical protein